MMKSPIVKGVWTHQEGDKYLVVGTDLMGQRVRIEGVNWMYIRAINVWQGNKYLIRDDKRYLIHRIVNKESV